MAEPLVPPRMLFRFSAPCHRTSLTWSPQGLDLDDSYRLPSLHELEGARTLADVRAAWSDAGIFLLVRVDGKKQPPWCRDSRLDESDGLQVWIDTRDTHNVHRASRFCHRFAFLPTGGGPRRDQPVADQMLINRAREHARPVRPNQLKVHVRNHSDGYSLAVFIPAAALTGFEPADHPKLGFTYALIDRERGIQSFSSGAELPFDEDPSLWGTLELVD
jgi:hypothetical protein